MTEPKHKMLHMKLPTHEQRRTATITKTRLYEFDPLKTHFYIAKLGFTGYTLFFLFLLKNIDCGYSLEPPCRGGSNEYLQSMFWAEMWKLSEFSFWSENVQFLEVKFSIYLNRRVFVMRGTALERSVKKQLWGLKPILLARNLTLNSDAASTYKHMSQRTTKPTIRPVWPAKTQISLYIHLVWQGFSFIPLWIAGRL